MSSIINERHNDIKEIGAEQKANIKQETNQRGKLMLEEK